MKGQFPIMAEGWVPQIMRQTGNLHEFRVHTVCAEIGVVAVDPFGYAFCYLGHFQGMGEAISEDISFMGREKLRFSLKSAK